MADKSDAEPLAFDETEDAKEVQTLPHSVEEEAKQLDVASASEEPDLEALLDDALEDFSRPADGQQPEEQASTSQPAAPRFDPLGKRPVRKSTKPAGLAFDPLAGRSRGGQASSSQAATEPGSFGAVPPDFSDLDEDALQKGLAQLMAELAEVEGTHQGQQPRPGETAAAAKMSETLRALSEQSAALRVASSGAAGHGGTDDDFLSDPLFSRLQEQFGAQDGAGGPGALNNLADTLMHQLISKEVLYQPMKDIGERYPEWLAAHRSSLPPDELRRYEQQYTHIQQILSIYEHDPANYTRLFDALQQMQACGQPPQDIVSELAPGLSFDGDGLPKLPGGMPGTGCVLQ